MSVVWREQSTGATPRQGLRLPAELTSRLRVIGSGRRPMDSLGFRRPVLADRPASAV
jgi:hypothetical protein